MAEKVCVYVRQAGQYWSQREKRCKWKLVFGYMYIYLGMLHVCSSITFFLFILFSMWLFVRCACIINVIRYLPRMWPIGRARADVGRLRECPTVGVRKWQQQKWSSIISVDSEDLLEAFASCVCYNRFIIAQWGLSNVGTSILVIVPPPMAGILSS